MLWQAFAADQQVVLLIDEIDKADIEFPNDLLVELDQMEFSVYETSERIKAKHRRSSSLLPTMKKSCPMPFCGAAFFITFNFLIAPPCSKLSTSTIQFATGSSQGSARYFLSSSQCSRP